MSYCPNCSAKLPENQDAQCWKCDAILIFPSKLRPVLKPIEQAIESSSDRFELDVAERGDNSAQSLVVIEPRGGGIQMFFRVLAILVALVFLVGGGFCLAIGATGTIGAISVFSLGIGVVLCLFGFGVFRKVSGLGEPPGEQ